jgi:hypothetical protein
MTTTPREFFDNNVRPAYEAWQAEPLSEWKMNAAVAMLNNMAAWVFVHWCPYGSPTNKLAVYRAKNEGDYRTARWRGTNVRTSLWCATSRMVTSTSYSADQIGK